MIVYVQITPFNFEIQNIMEQFPKYVVTIVTSPVPQNRSGAGCRMVRPWTAKGSFEKRELDSTLVV